MDKDKVVIYLDRYNDLLEKEKTLVFSDYTKLNKKIEGLEEELKEAKFFKELETVEVYFKKDYKYSYHDYFGGPFQVNVIKVLNSSSKGMLLEDEQLIVGLVDRLNYKIIEYIENKAIDLKELQDSLWAQQADLDKMKKEYFEEKIKSSSFLEKIKLLF